ncbi:MAG: amino acid ABC transporter substrate-binding protein, partial [Ruminococcaceae bacterium]|nr:amino acid ABC transporter substrate-binding protein [Oscillospiraceae bacterium]
MKKIIAIALVLCIALALCACGGGASKEESNVIKIGVYEPLSGDNGAGGKQEVLGMQYANYECPTVEIGGKTYNVELVIADNESSNDKAVSAATQLISADCSVVLGSYGSGVSIAASDTFAEAGLAAIGVTCTNPQVTAGNDHYFRICFLDPFQGAVQANFAKNELGAKTAYCLGQLGNDYDQGLINYFKQAAESQGMKVITAEFPENNSDFTSYLTNAKNEGADVIFAPCSISYAQLIVEQAYAQGIDIPLLAGDTWDSNAILAAAEGKDLSIYVSTFYAEGGDPDFEKGIKEWLNSNSEAMTNNGGNDMIAAVTVMG